MQISKLGPRYYNNNNFRGSGKNVFSLAEKKNYMSLPYTPAYFHPSFGMSNARGMLSRAQLLQSVFAEKHFRYLLPHEVWSDGKIMQTVMNFGKTLDKLIDNGTFGKEHIQSAIDEILPEYARGKIIVKNFLELAQDLKNGQQGENVINNRVNCNALVVNRNCNSTIYLQFREFTDNNERINFEVDAQHELKHALSARLQNIMIKDIYKNNFTACSFQHDIFERIKQTFNDQYYPPYEVTQTKLLPQHMLSEFGYSSLGELDDDFENVINMLVRKEKQSGKLSIESNKGWRQFYRYLRHHAKDEKEAYQTGIRWREIFDDTDTPTTAETIPLFYAEMERFFAKKEKECMRLGQN